MATLSCYFLGGNIKNGFHYLWQIVKFIFSTNRFAKSSLFHSCLFLLVWCDLGNRRVFRVNPRGYEKFFLSPFLLYNIEKNVHWRISDINGENPKCSILLSDFIVFCVLYCLKLSFIFVFIFFCLFYFPILLTWKNFTKIAKVLCTDVISFEVLEMH